MNMKTKRNLNVAICKLDFKWDYEIYSLLLSAHKPAGVSGVMVSIVAFQAVDRGSIPCWRNFVVTCNSHQIKQEKTLKNVRQAAAPAGTSRHQQAPAGVSGVMASIVAFQAVDRGSIPRCRNCLFAFLNSRWQFRGIWKKICQKWDSNPRPHLWTRTLLATLLAKGSHPWVWRLRPLGHPDNGH